MDRMHNILNNITSFLLNSSIEKTEVKNSQAIENETPEMELMEYKNDFLEMNIGSLKAIMQHANNILSSIDDPSVKANLTESWLQGKIAITEDYMRTIHDFVKYVPSDDDDSLAGDKMGLWDNIRKKKEKEGKKYRPAKRGDEDRPDPEMWKKLTEGNKVCSHCGLATGCCMCGG